MVQSVPLERLPADICFPAELSAKISFDVEGRRLQFDGFMSKTDFDKLVRLHNDLEYQRALEKLFQASAFRPAPIKAKKSHAPLLYTGIAAIAVGTAIAAFFLH